MTIFDYVKTALCFIYMVKTRLILILAVAFPAIIFQGLRYIVELYLTSESQEKCVNPVIIRYVNIRIIAGVYMN